MCALFRYRRDPADREGIERAKAALRIAKQIEHHADQSFIEHRELQRRNGFGGKIHKALGGN